MIVSTEIPIKIILKKFKYMRNWASRGMFYLLYGIFSLGSFCLTELKAINVIFACALGAAGILYLLCYCSCRKK